MIVISPKHQGARASSPTKAYTHKSYLATVEDLLACRVSPP